MSKKKLFVITLSLLTVSAMYANAATSKNSKVYQSDQEPEFMNESDLMLTQFGNTSYSFKWVQFCDEIPIGDWSDSFILKCTKSTLMDSGEVISESTYATDMYLLDDSMAEIDLACDNNEFIVYGKKAGTTKIVAKISIDGDTLELSRDITITPEQEE